MARPKKEEQYLVDLRNEIIWSLDQQGYDGPQIGKVMNLDRSVVSRTVKKKPNRWSPIFGKLA